MTGVYRKMMGQANNISARLIRYCDANTDLAVSDEDQLLGRKAPSDDPKGQLLAAQLTFELGVSAYATMVLRELLKFDTAPESQKQRSMGYAPTSQPAANGTGSDVPTQMVKTAESTPAA